MKKNSWYTTTMYVTLAIMNSVYAEVETVNQAEVSADTIKTEEKLQDADSKAASQEQEKLKAAFTQIRQERDQLQQQYEALRAQEKKHQQSEQERQSLVIKVEQLEKQIAQQVNEIQKLATDNTRLRQSAETIKKLEEQQQQLELKIAQLQTENQQYQLEIKHHLSQVYVVQPHDSLAKIAEKLCGKQTAWPLIMKKNRYQIEDVDLLTVGTTLHLPDECIGHSI